MASIVLPYKWKPRSYQMDTWRYFQGPEEGKRGAEVWHRRAGNDLFAINLIQTKIPERVGTYWHMLPTYKQGRNIVWDGHTRDGRPFLDHFHPDLVESKNGTMMQMKFYNGSIYQVVGTDDINSLVGTNPVGVVFSEYSLHDPGAWEYIRPILAENGGWALFIYTARGRNHGYNLIEMAKRNPKWHHSVLVAGSGPEATKRDDGTPVIGDDIIQEERESGMDEAMIQQEFFCSFESPFVGAYYGPQMLAAEKGKRIMDDIPYDPRLPVHTAWDLGMDDTTTIWAWQEYGFEIRLINYYEQSGEGLQHYAKLLKGQVINQQEWGEYAYGTHWAPHDITVRELGTGKSRREVAKSMGIKFEVIKKHDLLDGIEMARSIIPMCYFSMRTCARGIEGLRQYRKEWDERNKCFKSRPLHDWASNPADAFRQLAMARKNRPKSNKQPQERTVDEYNYLGASA